MKNSVKKICLIIMAALLVFATAACESNSGKGVVNNGDGRDEVTYGKYAQSYVTDADIRKQLEEAPESQFVNDRITIGANVYERVVANPCRKDAVFSDGVTKIVAGQTYYFNVAPIEWQVISPAGSVGQCVVISKHILDVSLFSEATEVNDLGIYPNDWSVSNLQGFMNGEFADTAFSSLEANSIIITNVVSAHPQSFFKGHSSAIKDVWNKVYALSYKEITSAEWGFAENGEDYDCYRMAAPTDYAKAKGAWFFESSVTEASPDYERDMLMNGNGNYWLRTVGAGDANAAIVRYNGTVGKHEQYVADSCGVRPAMSITVA